MNLIERYLNTAVYLFGGFGVSWTVLVMCLASFKRKGKGAPAYLRADSELHLWGWDLLRAERYREAARPLLLAARIVFWTGIGLGVLTVGAIVLSAAF